MKKLKLFSDFVPSSYTTECVTEAVKEILEGMESIDDPKIEPRSPNVTLLLQDNSKNKGEKPVGIEAIREFITVLWIKYQAVQSRGEKSKILDSICVTLDVHRKAAIRLMRKKTLPGLRQNSGSRKEKYSKDSKRWLVHLWMRMGRMNARKMVSALPEWLPLYLEVDIPRAVKVAILSMSSSTIDRILKPIRAQLKRNSNSGTRKSQHLALIPLRALGVEVSELGHVEVDLVAHCGGSLSGSHAWTVTMTDIFSGWTCARVVLGKEAQKVVTAMQGVVDDFPFVIKAFYFDNGTEFINSTMIDAFNKKCELYRSRPYKKNDQAHVEQKNHVFVRELFGYTRVDEAKIIEKMNDIYINDWQDLQNYFVPSAKTESKIRIGSKIKRKMALPKTAFDRVLENPNVSETVKGRLSEAKMGISPWVLRSEMRKKLKKLWKHFVTETKWTGGEFHVA